MGHAYVNPHALICARILSRDAAQPVDRALIERRLAAALALRRRLNAGAPTTAGYSASRMGCRGWCWIVTAK